ncbi:MAG: [LysW]-aminoadipate kinase [Planctomycetes bacterium]|nr:[LysW]-aminoadipate kinase [Planctomycetota bacterium]
MRTDTIVVKIGGAAGNEQAGLLDDLVALGGDRGRIVLVHGGSAETDRLATALGHPSETLVSPQGQESRRCDRRTLEIFAQATALVNRRLVEEARGRGLDAFGLSGLDGGLVRARRKDTLRALIGGRPVIVRDDWTGRIESVRVEILERLLGLGLLPVVAPLASGVAGEMLNVDGDRLAAAIAVALRATRLVILSDVEGLRRRAVDPSSLVPRIGRGELVEAGRWAEGRMKKKVLGVEEALAGGVEVAIIATSRGERPLSAALAGGGSHFGDQAAHEAQR